MRRLTTRLSTTLSTLLLATTVVGCADESENTGEGTLRLTAYGEAYIEDHIPAEDVIDGWRIEFDTFLVGFEDLAADGTPMGESYVVDLTGNTDGAGHVLVEEPFPAGGLTEAGYRIAPPSADAKLVAGASSEDLDAMVASGQSIWVSGEATRGGETIGFEWAFTTDTHYERCESKQTVVDGETATSQFTVHADHFFYDDLDSEEPNVAFDLIASADADGDGIVTEAELRATDIRSEQRYQVGSRDIGDLWGFIEAQTATLGHIDGEGHCDLGS